VDSTAYPAAVVAPLGDPYTVAWKKPLSRSTALLQLVHDVLNG
jgi:hypothetical protein